MNREIIGSTESTLKDRIKIVGGKRIHESTRMALNPSEHIRRSGRKSGSTCSCTYPSKHPGDFPIGKSLMEPEKSRMFSESISCRSSRSPDDPMVRSYRQYHRAWAGSKRRPGIAKPSEVRIRAENSHGILFCVTLRTSVFQPFFRVMLNLSESGVMARATLAE